MSCRSMCQWWMCAHVGAGGGSVARGDARASFVMDHGRFGPQGALGGADGAVNEVDVWRGGGKYTLDHLSKEQDIALAAGDRVRVITPDGGGYGDPETRDPELSARNKHLGRTQVLHAAKPQWDIRALPELECWNAVIPDQVRERAVSYFQPT